MVEQTMKDVKCSGCPRTLRIPAAWTDSVRCAYCGAETRLGPESTASSHAPSGVILLLKWASALLLLVALGVACYHWRSHLRLDDLVTSLSRWGVLHPTSDSLAPSEPEDFPADDEPGKTTPGPTRPPAPLDEEEPQEMPPPLPTSTAPAQVSSGNVPSPITGPPHERKTPNETVPFPPQAPSGAELAPTPNNRDSLPKPEPGIPISSSSQDSSSPQRPQDWPSYSGELSGRNEFRVQNRINTTITVGLRSEGKGKDFSIPANSSRSMYVPDGRYQVFFQYSHEPESLYQGDDVTLVNGMAEISILQVVGRPIGDNYRTRRVK